VKSLRVIALSYVGLLVGLPTIFLFQRAFASGVSAWWHQVDTASFAAALRLSLEIALVVVPLNTVVGVFGAVLVARSSSRWSRLLELCYDVPASVSPVIIGLALVLAYSRLGWFGGALLAHGIAVLFSPIGIALASTAVSLPYVLRSVVPVLRERGRDAELASFSLGASPTRTFWLVTWPAIRWSVLYGVTLTLTRTLGEFGAVLVVSGNISAKTQTLPIFIYDQWDQNQNALGTYAGALVLVLVAVLIMIITNLFQRKEASRRVLAAR
jgi:sulfate/thiosulfate transport system permease protein